MARLQYPAGVAFLQFPSEQNAMIRGFKLNHEKIIKRYEWKVLYFTINECALTAILYETHFPGQKMSIIKSKFDSFFGHSCYQYFFKNSRIMSLAR